MAFERNKYMICMSQESLHLLYRFLRTKKAHTLIALLNEHVEVRGLAPDYCPFVVLRIPDNTTAEYGRRVDIGLIGLLL